MLNPIKPSSSMETSSHGFLSGEYYESPGAYKDKSIILSTIDETIAIQCIMKSLYNIKG